MAEKGKRLRKILERAGLKGKLKQVESLEEAHLVLIMETQGQICVYFYRRLQMGIRKRGNTSEGRNLFPGLH